MPSAQRQPYGQHHWVGLPRRQKRWQLQVDIRVVFALLLEPGIEQFRVDDVAASDLDDGDFLRLCEHVDGILANADALGSLLDRVS